MGVVGAPSTSLFSKAPEAEVMMAEAEVIMPEAEVMMAEAEVMMAEAEVMMVGERDNKRQRRW